MREEKTAVKITDGYLPARRRLLDVLSVNKRTVERAITVLLQKTLLEKHSITKYLRTTEQWIKEIYYWKESSKKKG